MPKLFTAVNATGMDNITTVKLLRDSVKGALTAVKMFRVTATIITELKRMKQFYASFKAMLCYDMSHYENGVICF